MRPLTVTSKRLLHFGIMMVKLLASKRRNEYAVARNELAYFL